MTMEGADETPERLIEQRTIQLAKELGIDVSKLQLIHVDTQGIEPNKRYSVDLHNRRLVPVERPIDKEKMPESASYQQCKHEQKEG
jgi:hypothetical protein